MAVQQITRKNGTRVYKLEDGTVVPSVTTILKVIGKDGLMYWAANVERELVIEAACQLQQELARTTALPVAVYRSALTERVGLVKAHQKQKDAAAEIGAQAHKRIEWAIHQQLGREVGPEPRCSDEAQWAVMAWEDWMRAHDVRPILSEQVVYSETHRYAGTLDLVAIVDGVRTLIDFKTSKSIYAEAHLQNVAYQMALAEMGQTPCEAGAIVRIPKNLNDPAFEVQPTPPASVLYPVFLHARHLYDWWAEEDAKSKAAWRARKQAADKEGAAA